jgi:probable rRNA maturation factor
MKRKIMSNRILVSVQDEIPVPAWFDRIEPYEQKVLEKLGYDGEELSILFCTDAFIQELNKSYRSIDAATDILSFENGDSYTDESGVEWITAGDLIISLDTLPKNAAYFGVPENEELKRLLIHGTLHLNGMDHGDSHIEPGIEPEDEMLKLQETVLRSFSDEKIITG